MILKIILLNKRSKTQKRTHTVLFYLYKTRKCKLIRAEFGEGLGSIEWKRLQRHKKILLGVNHYLDCDDNFMCQNLTNFTPYVHKLLLTFLP